MNQLTLLFNLVALGTALYYFIYIFPKKRLEKELNKLNLKLNGRRDNSSIFTGKYDGRSVIFETMGNQVIVDTFPKNKLKISTDELFNFYRNNGKVKEILEKYRRNYKELGSKDSTNNSRDTSQNPSAITMLFNKNEVNKEKDIKSILDLQSEIISLLELTYG